MNLSRQTMKQIQIGTLLAGLLAALTAGPLLARLSEPDHVLYGTATWFGEPLVAGTVISLRLDGSADVLTTYTLGQNAQLGGLYALRIPMDSLDPRLPGRARPGEGASVFINDSIVANVIIGDYGEAQRLDIDPAFLTGTTPAIVISPAQVQEGNSGTSTMLFSVNLTVPSQDPVSFNWTTSNGTATGGVGSCESGSDFIHDNTIGDFPAGQTSTSIAISVCGDTIVEDNETFSVDLSNPTNAIIQFQSATGTILNDDGQPQVRVADTVVWEPATGTATATFEVLLSRAFTQDVQVDFETLSDTATGGIDYVGTAGRLTIPAGSMSAVVEVSILADGFVETPEALTLNLSNPANATISDAVGLAIILDNDSASENELADVAQNGVNGVEGLAGPSDAVFSPDNQYLYVSTLVSRTIVTFSVSNFGVMGFLGKIDAQTAGFEAGLFAGIQSITLSPDGNYLYAAASGNNGIMVLSRDSGDGSLSLVGTIANGDDSSGTEVSGLATVWDLVLSSDGSHLYAAGSGDDAVAAFSVDAGSGALTFLESEVNGANDPGDSGAAVAFVDRPVSVRLSPDGSRLLVGSDFSSAFTVFERDGAGELSFVDTFRNNVSGVSGIGGASDLDVSPDGSHVYVLGRSDDTLAQFSLVGGSASFMAALDRQADRFAGLDGPDAVTISPAGDALYAVGFEDSSFVMFRRVTDVQSSAYGDLNFAEIRLDNTGGITTLGGPTSVAVSPNGNFVVVTAGVDNAVNLFSDDSVLTIFANGFEGP